MIDTIAQIPEFIWIILGNLLGIPLGVLLAHLLSRKSRIYELKLNITLQLLREFNSYRADDEYSHVNILHCLSDADVIFSSDKIGSEIDIFFNEYKDEKFVGRINLDRVPKILKLMFEDIAPKFMKHKRSKRSSAST